MQFLIFFDNSLIVILIYILKNVGIKLPIRLSLFQFFFVPNYIQIYIYIYIYMYVYIYMYIYVLYILYIIYMQQIFIMLLGNFLDICIYI